MSVSFNESDCARPHDVHVEGNMAAKRVYQKEYYAKNSDVLAAYQKEYRANNKDKRRAYLANNKEAIAARAQERYAKNKEASLEYQKEYYVNNKEACAAKNKEWRVNNKEAYEAKRKEWVANNKEAIAARLKEYRAKNLEKGRAASHRRRVRMMGIDCAIDPAIASWSKAWHMLRRVRCYWCEESFSPKVCHEDHIVAVSIGGQHKIANMCISCAPCNLRKWAHPLPTWNATLSSPVLAL